MRNSRRSCSSSRGDVIVARTSDQPRQVEENIDLFMNALYEAIILVVFVSAIGFWDWRSALLMALSIPITLAMSLGMAAVLGLSAAGRHRHTHDRVGLAGRQPRRGGRCDQARTWAGHPPQIASWLGPTRLTKAIVYATITNVVAYLPFLMLTGSTGDFRYSLPVIMTCALVASLIVAKTFIPLLGYYALRRLRDPKCPSRTSPARVHRSLRKDGRHTHRTPMASVSGLPAVSCSRRL